MSWRACVRSVGLRRRLRDDLLEVIELLAALRAELGKLGFVVARLVHVTDLDEQLALIFERALVIGIELERLLVEGLRGLGVAALAQAEAEQIVDVGVLDAFVSVEI